MWGHFIRAYSQPSSLPWPSALSTHTDRHNHQQWLVLFTIIVIAILFSFASSREQLPSDSMLSKIAKGHDSNAPPRVKRLRSNIVDFFMSNEIIANKTAELYEDAACAGASHVRHLRHLGHPEDRHRNVLTRLLKNSRWPKLYHADIRVYNRRRTEMHKLPILPPHEFIETIFAHVHERVRNKNELEASCHSLGFDAAGFGSIVSRRSGIDRRACNW